MIAISFRKLVAILLVLVILASFGITAIPLNASADSGETTTHFITSFEAGYGNMLESKLDGNRVKNVGFVADVGRLIGDATYLVRSDTLSGSPDFKPEEGKHNLFDYNTDSKFLTEKRPTAQNPVEVILELERPGKVATYLIASANDEPGRDPVSWTFSGSNDRNTWTLLDSQSGIYFSSRFQKKTFEFENTTAYQYYKITISENNGAPMTQFSELQIADRKQPGKGPDYTGLVDLSTLSGSEDFKPEESKPMLFDYNTFSKFLTDKKPTAHDPVLVSFRMKQPVAVSSYIIGAGPDELGRNPKTWRFEGSQDGTNWVTLDQQFGIVFKAEQETRQFNFSNQTKYSYYRIVITENNGTPMTQFSELQLYGSAEGETSEEPINDGLSPMKTRKSRGPSASFNTLTSTGWTGWSALEILGKHIGSGEAYCYNVIYDGLSIPVTKNTQLSYVFFPALYDPNNYDYDYTSQHMAVDLKFTDDSYLSQLKAEDQNGTVVSPMDQGQSGILAYMQ